uniref:Uncharacterized protein n=1 Tax=Pelodiscus sinensis TaxID=13735 RepID=K7EX75_PELSI
SSGDENRQGLTYTQTPPPVSPHACARPECTRKHHRLYLHTPAHAPNVHANTTACISTRLRTPRMYTQTPPPVSPHACARPECTRKHHRLYLHTPAHAPNVHANTTACISTRLRTPRMYTQTPPPVSPHACARPECTRKHHRLYLHTPAHAPNVHANTTACISTRLRTPRMYTQTPPPVSPHACARPECTRKHHRLYLHTPAHAPNVHANTTACISTRLRTPRMYTQTPPPVSPHACARPECTRKHHRLYLHT